VQQRQDGAALRRADELASAERAHVQEIGAWPARPDPQRTGSSPSLSQ
jgi:hypothetical protein